MVTQEEKRQIESFFSKCVTFAYCDDFTQTVSQTLAMYKQDHADFQARFQENTEIIHRFDEILCEKANKFQFTQLLEDFTQYKEYSDAALQHLSWSSQAQQEEGHKKKPTVQQLLEEKLLGHFNQRCAELNAKIIEQDELREQFEKEQAKSAGHGQGDPQVYEMLA